MRLSERHQLLLAKRHRADANLEDLHKAVDAFMENRPHALATQLDMENGIAEVWPVVSGDEINPVAAIAGDVIHNLRASLDHLAYQLACLVNDPPTCKTEFPIYWQPRRFRREGRPKISCLDSGDRGIIEMHQPYHPSGSFQDWPKEHPLWLLQSMDIEDKHKLINVVAVAASFRELVPVCRDVEIVETFEMVTGQLKHGEPVAWYKVVQTGPKPQMYVDGYGSYSVVFGEGTPAADEGLFKTLERITEAVDKVLLAFRPRFSDWG